MDKKFSVLNVLNLKVPVVLWSIVSALLLLTPLASCSSDTDKPTIIRSTAVPDDGYKPPQANKKQPDKQKPKIVSYRKHEPADV